MTVARSFASQDGSTNACGSGKKGSSGLFQYPIPRRSFTLRTPALVEMVRSLPGPKAGWWSMITPQSLPNFKEPYPLHRPLPVPATTKKALRFISDLDASTKKALRFTSDLDASTKKALRFTSDLDATTFLLDATKKRLFDSPLTWMHPPKRLFDSPLTWMQPPFCWMQPRKRLFDSPLTWMQPPFCWMQPRKRLFA